MAIKVPTLYEWLGGAEPLNRLIDRFYQKVPAASAWHVSYLQSAILKIDRKSPGNHRAFSF